MRFLEPMLILILGCKRISDIRYIYVYIYIQILQKHSDKNKKWRQDILHFKNFISNASALNRKHAGQTM